MANAAKRIARLKRIDRAAVFVITLGGLAVVVGVLGILLFIVAEALPMFRAAEVTSREPIPLGANRAPGGPAMRALGIDEYRTLLLHRRPRCARGVLRHERRRTGARVPVSGARTRHPVVASSRSLLGNFLAAGTSDGRVALAQARYIPKYENEKLSGLDVSVRERGLATVDPAGRPVREVELQRGERRHARTSPPSSATTRSRCGARTMRVRRGRPSSRLRAAASHARAASAGGARLPRRPDRTDLYYWVFDEDEPRLTDVVSVANEPVTALEFLIGGTSLVLGTGERGGHELVSRRGGRRTGDHAPGARLEPQGSAVVAFAPSPRERSFAATGADGTLVLRYQTSERTLARLPGVGAMSRLVIAPKADAIYALTDDSLRTYALSNPHPEISWRALFGKVWYEGYAEPEYVWQSTGGTDDFEPKLSLMPLVFGTIKGTFYAMLFAIPHRGGCRRSTRRSSCIRTSRRRSSRRWRSWPRCRAW